MSLMMQPVHELIITRAEVETIAWQSESGGSVRDDVSLSLEVRSSTLNNDPRKVTGDVVLNSSPGYEGYSPMRGSLIFYSQDRFHAAIEVPETLLMRLWSCYAVQPEWMLLTFWEAPEVPAISQSVDGQFRIGFRAGSTRSAKEN